MYGWRGWRRCATYAIHLSKCHFNGFSFLIITATNPNGEKENINPKKKQVAKRAGAKNGTAAAPKQPKPSKGKFLSILAYIQGGVSGWP